MEKVCWSNLVMLLGLVRDTIDSCQGANEKDRDRIYTTATTVSNYIIGKCSGIIVQEIEQEKELARESGFSDINDSGWLQAVLSSNTDDELAQTIINVSELLDVDSKDVIPLGFDSLKGRVERQVKVNKQKMMVKE